MNEDLFRDITIKFLKGDATPHEKRMLISSIKDDPGREELYYYYLSQHENESPQFLPEVDSRHEAYEKFLQGGIQVPEFDLYSYHGNGQTNQRAMNRSWWLAASVIILISAGVYVLNDSFSYKTYGAENGMIKLVALEDGSMVTLNANSSIKIRRNFLDQEDREVWIKGEAFFEVMKKDDQQKFVVHTSNFDIEVLGTKFNVSNRRGKAEVMLSEGKVKLVARNGEALMMKPGEHVSASSEAGLFQKQLVKPEKYEAWRQNKLVFDNTPLAKVAEIIHDHYGVDVIVSDSLLATRQFTGTLPNNDLDVILLALGTAYNIEIDRQHDRIILK